MILVIFLGIVFVVFWIIISQDGSKRDRGTYFYENGRRIELKDYYKNASHQGCKDSFCRYEDKKGQDFYCKYYKEKLEPRDKCPMFVEHELAGFLASALEDQINGKELHFDD